MIKKDCMTGEVPEMPENFPDTVQDKVACAMYDMFSLIESANRAAKQFARLNSLLASCGGKLPNVITRNELKTAARHVDRVTEDLLSVSGLMLEVGNKVKEDSHE